ncbi:unnamed protein product [Symbiodinium microadriaticum]|nr:unnamed protein product [Symbiodinium microadriaticum]
MVEQPMKYFLTEKADQIATALKSFMEESLTIDALRRDEEAWAMDTEFGLNFNLMKRYIVGVITPDGLPNLSDHRVALIHISCTYNLHEGVRKRGGKGQVKEWAGEEAGRLRNKRTQILKRLYALKMGWIEAEDEGEEEALMNEEPPNDDDIDDEPADADGHDDNEDDSAAADAGEADGAPDDRAEAIEDLDALLEELKNSYAASSHISGNRGSDPELSGDHGSDAQLSGDRGSEAQLSGDHGSDAESFLGPEDVPAPHEVLCEADMQELADMELEDRKPHEAVVPASMQEEYSEELMGLLNTDLDAAAEDVNEVREKQRELKACRKQELKDPDVCE